MNTIQEDFHKDMIKIGVTHTLLGEQILYHAMDKLVEDPILLCCVSKAVYADISARMDTNPACIERNLRTFVHKLWNIDDHEYLDRIAGRHLKKKPTNRQFLDMMRYYWYEKECAVAHSRTERGCL